MDLPNLDRYAQQYSNSNKQSLSNSNSTVSISEVFESLSDLIPDDDYRPFYVSRYKALGYHKFMWLAGKARAGGRDAARLFFWMLKNPDVVR